MRNTSKSMPEFLLQREHITTFITFLHLPAFKMFFVKDEERIITLHPSFFGPHVKKYLFDKLLNDVEGA